MLRNAFDLLGTEGTLRNILRMVSVARDTSDRLRVIIDNVPQATVLAGNTNNALQGASNAPTPWSANTWNILDQRFVYGEALNANWLMTKGRWTIT